MAVMFLVTRFPPGSTTVWLISWMSPSTFATSRIVARNWPWALSATLMSGCRIPRTSSCISSDRSKPTDTTASIIRSVE